MTSRRQIEANRRNSRKSCGPRSAAGKAKASRNALRHGLAARTSRPSVPPVAIETAARAICGNDADPQLFAQAIAIAENEIVLQAIRAHQIASFERFQEPHVMPFGKRGNARRQIEERDEYEALETAIVDLILPAPGMVASKESHPRTAPDHADEQDGATQKMSQ